MILLLPESFEFGELEKLSLLENLNLDTAAMQKEFYLNCEKVSVLKMMFT